MSSSAAEPVVPFSTAQGNWIRIGANKITSTTFDFSGPNANPSYPNVARVTAQFQFNRDCNTTVAGASKFSVVSCTVVQGPLCNNGFMVVTDEPIELKRIAGK